jgi:DNA-binding CsgD family transcriptional regulator
VNFLRFWLRLHSGLRHGCRSSQASWSDATADSTLKVGLAMYVCGIPILTRKALVTRQFGSDAWAQFFRDVASTHRCFRSLITADTLVPLPAFLAFHDELMRRFFKDDDVSHVKLGRDSCRWALGDGPLKTLLDGQGFGGVVASLPDFHRIFEHLIVGYIAQVVEMHCANPIYPIRLRGGAGKRYHYLLQTVRPKQNGRVSATPSVAEGSRHLSNRETEVLLLVAHGMTNEEIGDELRISKKTAQHHVARAYRKIGVSSRVRAAMWLAERGFLGEQLRPD